MGCTHPKADTYTIVSGHVSEEICECGAWRQIVMIPKAGDWQYPHKKKWYSRLSKATRKREFPKQRKRK